METAAIYFFGAIFALILIWTFFIKLAQFREELDYINAELARSRSSREYWKAQKRRLWLWFLFSIPRK